MGAGALNSVSVSAMEKNGQTKAINDLNKILDTIIDVSNGRERWLGERFGRHDFLPTQYIDEVLSEIGRLCKREENLLSETQRKITQVTLYLTIWAVYNENDGYRNHDLLLDALVNEYCPDFYGKQKVKEIVERHRDHQNKLAKSIFDHGISQDVIKEEINTLNSLINKL